MLQWARHIAGGVCTNGKPGFGVRNLSCILLRSFVTVPFQPFFGLCQLRKCAAAVWSAVAVWYLLPADCFDDILLLAVLGYGVKIYGLSGFVDKFHFAPTLSKMGFISLGPVFAV